MHKLVIIGNGFDLYCKLKSSFKDYFESQKLKGNGISEMLSLYNAMINDRNQFESLLKTYSMNYRENIFKDISIWEIYFYVYNFNNNEINWFDIEEQLAESVCKNSKGVVFWELFYNKINSIQYSINQELFNSSLSETLKFILFIFKGKFTNIQNINRGLIKIETENIDYIKIMSNWQNFLLEQLNLFELNFKYYIQKQVSISNSYLSFSNNLFQVLIGEYNTANIMSFNYTTSIKNDNIKKYENVHGMATDSGKIIIGIDNTKAKTDDFSSVFNKTFRKLEMFTKIKTKKISNVLDKSISHIVFFGHSLNKQDYSYFQTLFDFYKLYDSDVLLEFVYCIYDNNKSEEIRLNFVKKIYKLFDEYGNTFSNISQGNNLMHKLLNEKRLVISNISSL